MTYLKDDEDHTEHENNEQEAAGVQGQEVVFVGKIRLYIHTHKLQVRHSSVINQRDFSNTTKDTKAGSDTPLEIDHGFGTLKAL